MTWGISGQQLLEITYRGKNYTTIGRGGPLAKYTRCVSVAARGVASSLPTPSNSRAPRLRSTSFASLSFLLPFSFPLLYRLIHATVTSYILSFFSFLFFFEDRKKEYWRIRNGIFLDIAHVQICTILFYINDNMLFFVQSPS